VTVSARLAGKVALITGIGSGQGRAAAAVFARHGAHVFGCDLDAGSADDGAAEGNAAAKEAGSGGSVVPMQADAFSDDDVARWVGTAVEQHGRVDVLYNNAALADFGMFDEMDLERWRRSIQLELDGVFLPCKHAFPHMERADEPWSSVINTASVSGMLSTLLPAMPGGMSHATGKAGVIGLTRSLAEEYASRGIRVNSISPGSVETPSLKGTHYDTPEFLGAVTQKLLIKRRARPEEIAMCALFLASDESSYITGVNIPVDGGWTCF
jgi:NAD(P)-dependent dehydrogenase (short-subunit alcohol dehydrogenase family)